MVELVHPANHSTAHQNAPQAPGQLAQDLADVANFWSPVSLWIPDWIVASGWHQHAPFAFWLIEAARPRTLVELGTYTGFSYLAFCQAVQALGLGTTSCAIDTWKGDEHTGLYGDELFLPFKSYHDSRYTGFSQLIRSTFVEAVKYFDDLSIDLLHIDGRHFYDDVTQDFETWQPKLSPRAVVLIHDTNVREKDFGVWRFWKQLSDRYPTFEFKHGHGLGVLAAGNEIPSSLKSLFSASQPTTERIRQLYARLGSTISDKWDVMAARDAGTVNDRDLAGLTAELRACGEKVIALQGEVQAHGVLLNEVASLKSQVATLREDD